MSATSVPVGNSDLRHLGKPGLLARVQTLAFPLIINFWPVLLFVSQKAFVIPAVLLNGLGDSAYRRDLFLATLISAAGVIVYAFQAGNSYDQSHLIGFLLFAWSMPVINYGVRNDQNNLLLFLTYFTIFNSVMGFYLLVFDVDLYGLRGLNRIVGTDGQTHRVYFESASLAAVILLSAFRRRLIQLVAFLIVAGFVIFVARSVVIVLLLGLNLALPHVLRRSLAVKIAVVIAVMAALTVLYLYLPVLRPDVDLSLQVKQFQLDLILSSLNGDWLGWGWGSYYPELATDPDQPYQVEMQMPMLLLQLGPVAFAAILGVTLAIFLSAARRPEMGLARFAVYALIGFNNPWLFVPSWFLTCQLLFRYDDED
jgi:hypothetical protein